MFIIDKTTRKVNNEIKSKILKITERKYLTLKTKKGKELNKVLLNINDQLNKSTINEILQTVY